MINRPLTLRARVLVVDDDPSTRDFLVEILSREFEIESASDAKQALEMVIASPPALVICEVAIPAGGGEWLLNELRSRPALAGVPVLMLSAGADDALRLHLLSEGAQECLSKPFHPLELTIRARNLAGARLARQILEAEVERKTFDLATLAAEVSRRKKELENALEAARVATNRAVRENEMRTNFINLASHELNTPLTSILLTLYLIERDGMRPEDRKLWDRIRTAALRLKELVDSLVNYGRISAKETEVFDLPTICGQTLDELAPLAGRMKLSMEAEAGMPLQSSDPKLVRMMISSLVIGALKFSPNSIQVSLAFVPGKGHRISVRESGTGIGLALSEQIAEALGGSIEFESGCCTIWLPPAPGEITGK